MLQSANGLSECACVDAGVCCSRLTARRAGGPYERQRVDNAAADRGRALYAQYCINCHGSTAKGTDSGPDLIRSAVVLRDRLGNGIGPAIKKVGHASGHADRRRRSSTSRTSCISASRRSRAIATRAGR